MTQKVFVVGCQRSGTTLTGQILGAHRNAVLIDEHDGVLQWMLAELDASRRLEAAYLGWRSQRRARRNYKEPDKRVTVFGRLRQHVSHLILKSPNLTFSAREISRHTPDSPIVYLVRDVRDVVASIRSTRPAMLEIQSELIRSQPDLLRRFPRETQTLLDLRTPEHLRMAAMATVKMSVAGDFVESGLPTLLLRYEELVTDPALWIPRLIEHAGLRGTDSASAHHLSLTGTGPGGTRRSRAIDQRSVGRWRQVLSPAEGAEIQEAVARWNEALVFRRDAAAARAD